MKKLKFKTKSNSDLMHRKELKYNNELDLYSTKFPVWAYNGTPILFCSVTIDENNHVNYEIVDKDNKIYAPYYNDEYGKNNMIYIIDKRIRDKFMKLGFKELR